MKNITIIGVFLLTLTLTSCSTIEQAKMDFSNLKKSVVAYQSSKTYSNMYWTHLAPHNNNINYDY